MHKYTKRDNRVEKETAARSDCLGVWMGWVGEREKIFGDGGVDTGRLSCWMRVARWVLTDDQTTNDMLMQRFTREAV